MNTLYAFGCSCTYGVGLPDIDIDLNKGASKYAWPETLATKLNVNCINRGVPGASNLQILNNILNTEFGVDDIVVIMWSYFDRDYVFNENGSGVQLAHWVNPQIGRYWLLTHNDYDLKIRSWLNIYTAWLHLQKKNVKFYFGLTANVIKDPMNEKVLELCPPWAKEMTFAVTDFDDMSKTYGFALDSVHPGPETHNKLTEILFEHINNDKRI